MKLEEYLKENLHISSKKAKKITTLIEKYKEEYPKIKIKIKIPKYSKEEELFNSISHGIGAALSILALILMVIKAKTPIQETTVSLFGSTMIILYTISCIYHALSPRLEGKKILRVIDHCNVYLLVFGTYIPMSLLGIQGIIGWIFFGIVCSITVIGIVLTSINIDKFQSLEVICHLINGWIALLAIPKLLNTIGALGLLYLILGGIMYTIGSVIYKVGAKKKYMHSVFHIFCLLGTFFHFICVYFYLL